MAKLLEKNGAEMASALVSIAAPLKNFTNDPEFIKAFDSVRKDKLNAIQIYSEIIPHLFGDKHLRDTLQILSAVEGTPVSKMLKMNGTELLADAFKAWNEQLKPFFTQLGLSASTTQ